MQLSKTISNALAKNLLCFIFSITICSFSFHNVCKRFRKKKVSGKNYKCIKRSDRKNLAVFNVQRIGKYRSYFTDADSKKIADICRYRRRLIKTSLLSCMLGEKVCFQPNKTECWCKLLIYVHINTSTLYFIGQGPLSTFFIVMKNTNICVAVVVCILVYI